MFFAVTKVIHSINKSKHFSMFLFVYNSIQTSNSAEQYVYNITHQDVKTRYKTLFINPITN